LGWPEDASMRPPAASFVFVFVFVFVCVVVVVVVRVRLRVRDMPLCGHRT
jgi:hypothetical protein